MAAQPRTTALKAVQQDAVKVCKFEYDGVEYTFDPEALDDADVLEKYEEGQGIVPTKMVLGEEQWQTFKDTGKNGKRGSKEIAELIGLVFGAIGAPEGE